MREPLSPRDKLHLAALRGARLSVDLSRAKGRRRDAEVDLYFNACWRGAWWTHNHADEFDLSEPGALIHTRGYREVLTQLHILEGKK